MLSELLPLIVFLLKNDMLLSLSLGGDSIFSLVIINTFCDENLNIPVEPPKIFMKEKSLQMADRHNVCSADIHNL
jgi:hypothetical protein